MRFQVSKKLAQTIKTGLVLASMLATTILSNVSVAYAEDIIHTHIWATKYDENKHWEYCTVCKKVKDETAHKLKDNWEFGYESCHKSNGKNFSTRICECGYSYIYQKPHTEDDKWYNTGERMVHYKKCSTCNDWTKSGNCSNSNGKLGCTNPGKCSTCGYEATKDNHYITKDGKCRDCGKKFFDVGEFKVTYDKEYTTATINVTFKPLYNYVELTGVMGAYCGNYNYTSNKWTYKKNSDGSMDYTGVYTFDSSKQRKAVLNFLDRRGAVKINGVSVYIDANIKKLEIWQDHKKPEIKDVKQVDQATHNGWATIKELTITGKEDLSKIVTISILDKQTGDVIVDKAKTNVTKGEFSYKCTPPLEGPETGREYILKVEDEVGNVAEKTFTIYKTDCRAPLIRSSKEYKEWSQTKKLALELTDYGSGTPYTSLNDQVSYKKATKSGDKYIAEYTFADDNYGVTTYSMYLKDGLGNATKETIKVGKIDNTKPTVVDITSRIEDMDKESNSEKTQEENQTTQDNQENNVETKKQAIITVIANDMNQKLNSEGSGVVGYALTKTTDIPKEKEWQESNELKITEPGVYYVWVKDKAGNYADVTAITVKEDYSVEKGKEIVVEDDKDKEDSKNQTEDKKEDKKNNKKDTTPDTGDAKSYILIVGILFIISFASMVVIRKKRKVM